VTLREALRIEMMCCEDTMLDELASPGVTRRMVALTYAFALCSSERDTIDWRRVNRAIIDRWSPHALHWIKTEAWKLIEKKRKASAALTEEGET